MSDEVVIDGVVYISSKRASESFGYSQDYIGQLARAGKIDARRVSGLWYINMDSLRGHKTKADSYIPTPPSSKSEQKDLESIVSLDGFTFISASRASKLSGYNQDYIGQLARAGTIRAQSVGGRWFVDLAQLKEHKEEKDSLLAAVQTESVGLVKKDTHQSAPQNESDTHYRYMRDDRPVSTDSYVREIETVSPRTGEPEHDTADTTEIPIRVFKSTRDDRARETSIRPAKKVSHSSDMTRKYIVRTLVSVLFISGAAFAYRIVDWKGMAHGALGVFSSINSQAPTNDSAAALKSESDASTEGTLVQSLERVMRNLVTTKIVYRRNSF